MKKTPLTVKIPCILDTAVSILYLIIVLSFGRNIRSFGLPELLVIMFLAVNLICAYKCMQGNSVARYMLVVLKIPLVLLIPLTLFAPFLWAYLLIWNGASKEYFSSVKSGDNTVAETEDKLAES